MVEQWWDSNVVIGWSGYVLMRKLKGLRGKIRDWCRTRGAWGSAKIVSLEQKVHDLMVIMERDGVTEELRKERLMTLNDLWKEYRLEESMWLQKSRMKWVKEGDRNTRFFHRVCKEKASSRSLVNLRVDNQVCEEPGMIKQAVFDHFQAFFKAGARGSLRLTGEGFCKVTPEDKILLEVAFIEEEVWAAVMACDGNRAPGPDGFNFTFFREFWSLIKDDIMRLFAEFYDFGKLVKGLNAGFIALIPKKNIPEEVADYRPISLIGSVYKLIAKVLTARLQQVMQYLLLPNQFSFTKGRQIADCILIGNEVVDSLTRQDASGFLLKLDFAKAYDNIEWNFLLDMLEDLGFGVRWRSWIHSCITSATLAVLVNGSPTEFFAIEKGLRQGDPLSPLLFNLCVHGLSIMWSRLATQDRPCGVRLGPGLCLNHLQFADDTLAFCENDGAQLEEMFDVLMVFLWGSGLKLNYSKSVLVGCNVAMDSVQRLAIVLGVEVGTLPLQYLGSVLGGDPRRKIFWAPVIEKVRLALGAWGSNSVSLSGRLVVLRAVASAVPLYHMAVYKAPLGVVTDIEKLMRGFLWGRVGGGRRIAWVAWEQVCKGRDIGGLGVGFLKIRNKAMLLKWAWRFGVEHDMLWQKVVCAKYGISVNPLVLHRACMQSRSFSRYFFDIIHVLLEDTVLGRNFRDQCFCVVGSGNRINFWHDSWATTKALALLYPRLYAMVLHKHALVSELGSFSGGTWNWQIEFRRNFFDWEVQLFDEFLARIKAVVPAMDEDHLLWLGDQNGYYSVKVFCMQVELQLYGAPTWVVPAYVRKIVPPKVVLFLWQAAENKIAVLDNLHRRGVAVDAEAACAICGQASESVAHLLLHCDFMWGLWSRVLCREGVAWCVPATVLGLLQEWETLRSESDVGLWKVVPYALTWSTWLARNGLIFKGEEVAVEAVWDIHLTRIFWWLKASNQDCPYTLYDFIVQFREVRVSRRRRQSRVVEWVCPPVGFVKFNVDGAARGAPGPGGIGGVVRDSNGTIIGYFSMKVGTVFAHEAEIKAIRMALKFCKEFGVRQVLIESDSTLAVGWVNRRSLRPWKLLSDLHVIDLLKPEVECVDVYHVYREVNVQADFLAKSGCDREEDLRVYCSA
ncbi:uncharacterized protein LOC130744629 [Lotus japonicus]|uniref:uncharacterized protein LOC130744629 n=1 Tax=Lotus japonicus TaxID=34305 RepID=UPI002583750D|nr:uncharacterized protein LOC130744629 [Lotus japonicus]